MLRTGVEQGILGDVLEFGILLAKSGPAHGAAGGVWGFIDTNSLFLSLCKHSLLTAMASMQAVRSELARAGLKLARAPADGRCQYHSVCVSARNLGWDVGSHETLRASVAAYIKAHAKFYAPFIEGEVAEYVR